MSKFNQPIASLYPDDTFLTAFPAAAAGGGGIAVDGTITAASVNYNVADDTYVTLVDYTGSGWLLDYGIQMASATVVQMTVDGTASVMTFSDADGAVSQGSGYGRFPAQMYFASGLKIEAKVTSGSAGGSGNAWNNCVYTTGGSGGTPSVMKLAKNASVNSSSDTYEDILNVTTTGVLVTLGFKHSGANSTQVHIRYTVDGGSAVNLDFATSTQWGDPDNTHYGVAHHLLPFSTSMRVEGKDDTAAFASEAMRAACIYIDEL